MDSGQTTKNYIVYLIDAGFSLSDYDKYNISYLQSKYYIEIINVSGITSGSYAESYEYIESVKKINSVPELENYVMNLGRSSVFIDLMCFKNKVLDIRAILKKYRHKRVCISAGLQPGRNDFLRVLKNIIKIKLSSFFPQFIKHKNLPDIVILSGLMDCYDINLFYVKHKIFCHSFDYEKFITEKFSCENFYDSYAVFLDEDMPSHRDYKLLDLAPPTYERDYYPKIKTFFNKFGQKNNLKVIIAAHPRSNLDKLKRHWGGFHVVQGKTNDLVSRCAVVIAHNSTSISFAVLWNKPILLLTSDQIERSWIGPIIKFRKKLIGAYLFNIDHPFFKCDPQKLYLYSQKKYNKFIEMYIKQKNSAETPMWETFSQYLDLNIFEKN